MVTKQTNQKMYQTLVCLTPRLVEQLDALSKRQEDYCSRSAVIRRACFAYLKANEINANS